MRKPLSFLAVFIILLLTPLGVRYLQFYQLGGSRAAAPPVYDPASVSEFSVVVTPYATTFVDEPTVGRGRVLLDRAHRNEFTLDEIGYLDGRLAARGFELLSFTGGDLANTLRAVTAFVVITPLENFTPAEVQAVADFVARGGRLLLVGDPTRFSVSFTETAFSFDLVVESNKLPLNSLANEFNLIFNGDYLYNMVENEGNFRNILLQESAFAEDRLTAGLDRLALYSTHSLQVGRGGKALLTADENTWSSATDRAGGLVVAASSTQGRVLALGDVHLFIEPYATVYDNGRFTATIADFLTAMDTGAPQRNFVLADFPYFFQQSVDLVYTGAPDLGPDAFDEIIALQEAFRRVGKSLQLTAVPQDNRDVLYLGLFNQAADVAPLLTTDGISLTIQPPILTAAQQDAAEAAAEDMTKESSSSEKEGPAKEEGEPPENGPNVVAPLRLVESGLGKVQMSGTAVIYLHHTPTQRSVVVLAASAAGLETTVNRLLDLAPLNANYALADCLVQENLALCPTDIAAEEVEAELLSGGSPARPEAESEEAPPADAEEGMDQDNGEFLAGDVVPQGEIGLDETVSGTLGIDEAHAWTFSAGPALIDVVLSGETLDGVLELYDADNNLLGYADDGFAGDGEVLRGVEIPDDGIYTIVVSDFFGDEADYSLAVTAASAAAVPPGSGRLTNIFILFDDDGEALDGSLPSATVLADLLPAQYEVTLWTTSLDGRLQPNTLTGTDLLIWDTADYLDTAGFLDPDTEAIFSFLETNQSSLLMVGSAPSLFSFFDLYPLADLAVATADPLLSNGFTLGQVIPLGQTVQTVASEIMSDDLGVDDVLLFNRGPNSDLPGMVAAATTSEGLSEGQRLAILLFPFVLLPLEAQQTLLANLLAWFGGE